MAQQGKHPYNEIKAILKMYNTANQREISREMTYQDIKSSIDEIYLPAKTSKKTIQKHFQREILVANLSMLCIALYAIRVRPKKGVKGVLPRDWSGPEKKINPNYVLFLLLSQIAKYTLAIVQLVLTGLDTPARALLRTTIDLTWQTLVLLNSKDDFIRYVSGNDFDEGEKVWRELFSRGKLLRKLKEVENSLGPPELSLSFHEGRYQTYREHSHAIHSSYLAIAIGGHSFDPESETVGVDIFGGASLASTRTLRDLAWHLCYFQIMFHGILRAKFNFKLYRKKEFDMAIEIFTSIIAYFIATYMTKEKTESDAKVHFP